MITSSVDHPSSHPYMKVHAWMVPFCRGNQCAAFILSHFLSWHDWKLQRDSYYRQANDISEAHGDGRPHDENAYLFFSTAELVAATFMTFGKNAVTKALQLLEELGVISVHKNPNPRYYFDKTKYFRVYPEVCNKWLEENKCLFERKKVEKKNRRSQLLDFFDNLKMDNASAEIKLPTPQNELPSPEIGQPITDTTNNTTNKLNKINQTGDEIIKQNQKTHPAIVQTIINELIAKGFPKERFAYPAVIDSLIKIIEQGACTDDFLLAYYDLVRKKRGNHFAVNYLIATVKSNLERNKSANTSHSVCDDQTQCEPEPIYENDLKSAHWIPKELL